MKKKIKKNLKTVPQFFKREGVNRFINISLIVLLGLSVTLLMTLYINRIPQTLEVGMVAKKDIKADRNYEIVDERSTLQQRNEALHSILPVYDFDPTIQEEAIEKINAAFSAGSKFLDENKPPESENLKLSPEQENQLKVLFMEAMGGGISEEKYQLLRKNDFHPAMKQILVSLIHQAMHQPVVHKTAELEPLLEKGFILRKLSTEGKPSEEVIHDLSDVSELEGTQKKIRKTDIKSIEDPLNLEFLDRGSFRALKNIAVGLIKINTSYNGLETDTRKQKAVSNIKHIIIKVKRGESIVRSGDRFEPWHVTVFEGIQKERLKTNRVMKFVGTFLFVNLILFIVFYYAAKYIRKFKPDRKDLVFLGTTLLLFLIILRVGVFLSAVIRDDLPFSVGTGTLYYAIPIAAGAMLVRLILNSETALVFAVLLSLFSGIFLENNLQMTVYYLISGVFAAHAIAHVDKRSAVLVCGLFTGLVNALTIFSLNLISLVSIAGSVDALQIGVNTLTGLIGGIFTAMVVLVFTPVMEGIFNYTTDIKLLELANLSHPLLKEMIVRAPGTYHHSQLVGILSEAGAQAIGANPLLVRVGSYYHDIGKMKKPQYFIENQKGINPHEKLTPSMSALIIEAHVKDGLEMARKYKLPRKIADMIPQHQGTKLIGYFYNKAKKLENPAMGKIDQRDYRYDGPKPQTREAGIIMLADTVEASVRSLPEKTPQKIRAAVEKLVNQHFVDEQLDDCELTLRDLHQIASAFVKILVGIYHQRVEYPEEALLAGAKVHPLRKKAKGPYGSVPEQSSPSESNIAPLFRKKSDKDPSPPETA